MIGNNGGNWGVGDRRAPPRASLLRGVGGPSSGAVLNSVPLYKPGDRVDTRMGRGWTYNCTVVSVASISKNVIHYFLDTTDGRRIRCRQDSIAPRRTLVTEEP